MENLFYHFYDLFIIVLTLVTIFVSVKRGFSRTFIIIIGYILSIFVSYKLNDILSKSLYSNYVEEKNISIINENISRINFSQQYKVYIDSFGYNIAIDVNKLDEILMSGENTSEKVYDYCSGLNGEAISDKDLFMQKVNRGYINILSDYLKTDIPSLCFQNYDLSQELFDESIKMMYNNDKMLNASYIEENFIRKPVLSFIKTAMFIVIFSVIMIIFKYLASAIEDRNLIPAFGIVDHTLGLVNGIIETAILILIFTLIFKMLVNIGNDEMILFRTEDIEKTKIFKHIYNSNLFIDSRR
ncbi:MAG: CvpA family protein [Oscillospiraceae bacterium]|nr:CvpA family protein [Oscillospiraceae bacterium]